MNVRKYPKEMAAYVRELTEQNVPNSEQRKLCEEKFNTGPITQYAFCSYKSKLGITFKPRWTDEVIAFITEQVKTHSRKEVAELLREKFNWPEVTDDMVKGAMSRYGILTGRTGRFEKGNVSHNKGVPMTPEVREKCKASWFPKGHRPHNELPIGSRVRRADGYLVEKVRDEIGTKAHERWRPVQQLVWERAHGPIPEGKIVTFLDGNRDNFALENLALVSKREYIGMTHYGMRFEDADLTRTGLEITRLKLAILDKTKRK